MNRKIDVICFSGTGNTELMTMHVVERFIKADIEVAREALGSNYIPRENGELLLAFPVNAQAVSPYIWKFFKSMPEGKGTKVHVLMTMNESAVVLTPLKKILSKKGYIPKGTVEISMPNNLVMGEDKTAGRLEKAFELADQFAEQVVQNEDSWNETKKGSAFVSVLSRKTVLPWFGMRLFNKLETDPSKCLHCGLCVKECPVQNIQMEDVPVHKGNCQFCMHCGAVCKSGAIRVKGRPQCYIRHVSQIEEKPSEI